LGRLFGGGRLDRGLCAWCRLGFKPLLPLPIHIHKQAHNISKVLNLNRVLQTRSPTLTPTPTPSPINPNPNLNPNPVPNPTPTAHNQISRITLLFIVLTAIMWAMNALPNQDGGGPGAAMERRLMELRAAAAEAARQQAAGGVGVGEGVGAGVGVGVGEGGHTEL